MKLKQVRYCTSLAAIAIALGCVEPAAADILVLVDGTVLEGEVVSQTSRTLNFRFQQGGIWTTRTFGRRQIDRLVEQEGDQSDTGQPKEETGPSNPERSGPVERNPNATRIAIVPLHGQVGGMVDDGIRGTFDATMLEACFEEARDQGVDVVVLDINSPGGLVAEMEAICDTIIDWHDRLRIIAHTHDAFSAAAIITLCCKEVIVRPGSRIGAATIIKGNNRGGVSALEAKFASPHYARQRQYMQQSGHPYEVVSAMTIQETELWWSPTAGFTVDQPQSGDDWQKIDGRSTILTMTADDAERWGLASGRASSNRSLPEVLNLAGALEWVELDEIVERHNADLDRRLRRLKHYFTTYFTALGMLNQKMAALFEAHNGGDAETVRRLKREIPREVAKIRNAGRRILQADHTILARRVNVPDSFVDRIEEDNDLVSGISRLIDSTSTDGWEEAAQRLTEVLTRWRETLGFD